MEKIKVVQVGCGNMSVFTMRYVIENNMQMVGAVDINPDIIGKDIGEIMGMSSYGVTVRHSDELENLLIELKPDVCIFTTVSYIKDEKHLFTCAKNGVNAVTICEQAFFPFNSDPKLTAELDQLAKQNNCTITGSGYQDVFWGILPAAIVGASHRVTKIKGSSSYNLQDYGLATANAHGAGLTAEEFEEQIASADNISDEERQRQIDSGEFVPSYMWPTNGWLCDKLGLTVKRQTQRNVPTFSDKDIESKALGMTIKAGVVTGLSAIVTTETEEGITLEIEAIGKVYDEADCDKNDWTIYGEPDTNLVITNPKTVELTCAAAVNRIPDLIASKPGFIPTSQLGEMKYIVNKKQ